MENKVSPLKSLETDLIYYNESIRETAMDILKEKISKYPIFIAHQHESSIGELILDKNELNTEWNINAATFEDFKLKGIITQDKEDYFIGNYKDPKKFMCLFVIVPEGANFVYYPYN